MSTVFNRDSQKVKIKTEPFFGWPKMMLFRFDFLGKPRKYFRWSLLEFIFDFYECQKITLSGWFRPYQNIANFKYFYPLDRWYLSIL